jgi:SAM-dependent methyltransferase
MSTPTVTSQARNLLRRTLVAPFDRQLVRELEREIVGSCTSLLDLGCGRASPIGHFATRLTRCVGVDAFEPYLRESVEAGIHSDYRCLDVMEIDRNFAPASFDCVVALDLIEHLPRPAGLELLDMMERIASRKVIVFTPNGFVPQESYDGNEWQRHLSGWTAEEMEQRGYRVLGLHGWKPLRGELGQARWQPRRLWEMVALWTQPLVRQRPRQAFHLLCIKDLPAPAPDVQTPTA